MAQNTPQTPETKAAKSEAHPPATAPGTGLSAEHPFSFFDRMMDEYFPRGWMQPLRWWDHPLMRDISLPFGGAPKMDVIERDNEVVVKAEVPGVDKKDLEVNVDERAVTVRGTSHREHKEESGAYHRSEIVHGSFARTVSLPASVDAAKAKAQYKDGVLEISAPKIAGGGRRSIKVD